MVTSPYDGKILEWDENPKTNKSTILGTNHFWVKGFKFVQTSNEGTLLAISINGNHSLILISSDE